VTRLLTLNRLEADVLDPARCKAAVNTALAARFGGENWVPSLVNDQVYLDRKLMAERKAARPT
jgi:hypothetical protein